MHSLLKEGKEDAGKVRNEKFSFMGMNALLGETTEKKRKNKQTNNNNKKKKSAIKGKTLLQLFKSEVFFSSAAIIYSLGRKAK